MCDLTVDETRNVTASLKEIVSLADKLRTHAESITDTSFMDHEALAAVLSELRATVTSTEEWVVAKPQQHAGHTSA